MEISICSKLFRMDLYQGLPDFSPGVFVSKFIRSSKIVLIFFDIMFERFSRANQFIDTVLVLSVSVVLFFVSAWTYKNIEKRFMRGLKKSK